MSGKIEDNFKLKFLIEIELTEKEHRQLVSISDGDIGKMIAEHLKELATRKKRIKSFKKNCPFCGRAIIIYSNGHKMFLNSTRPDLA